MSDEIIDAHTHVHQTAADAARFLSAMSDRQAPHVGDLADAERVMEQCGIARMVILPWVHARTEFESVRRNFCQRGSSEEASLRSALAEQCTAYNIWAAELARVQPERFTAMVAVDPVMFGEDWARNEIRRGLSSGASGVKIVPVQIGLPPNDDRMAVVWDEAALARVPVVAQSGVFRGVEAGNAGHPSHYQDIAACYPRVRIVLAHVGMGAEAAVARLARRHDNVFVDTSQWLSQVPERWSTKAAAALFRRIGTERILFGSNYPICSPKTFIDKLTRLPLTADELEQIFFRNYHAVYGVTDGS